MLIFEVSVTSFRRVARGEKISLCHKLILNTTAAIEKAFCADCIPCFGKYGRKKEHFDTWLSKLQVAVSPVSLIFSHPCGIFW